MKYLLIIFSLLLSFNLYSEEYNFSWYPKDYANDQVIEMPNNDKYTIFLPDGVWEDNLGNYGNMLCVISAFTTAKKDIALNGYCEAIDNEKNKFWLNISRNSFEEAGVGYMKFISGNGKYKNIIGVSCPYAVQWLDNEGKTERQGSIIKLKCPEDSNIKNKLR